MAALFVLHVKIKKPKIDRTKTEFWILVFLVLALAAGIAAIWYVYLPETPTTDHGHVQH